MSNEYINHTLVITNKRVNDDVYKHDNIVVLEQKTGYRHIINILKRKYKFLDSIRFSRTNRTLVTQSLVENKIELLHIHFGTYAVFFMDICKELKIPFVVTFHGFDITSAVGRWPLYKKKLNSLFNNMSIGLVISEEMKIRLIQLGCPEEKVSVSYLGVPIDQFKPVDRSQRDGIRFLHAGRLTEKKGVESLIRCFTKAFRDQEEISLIIAGDGELKESLVHLVSELDIKDQISFIGNLSQKDLTQAYSDADVFVLNSRTDSNGTKEGLPIGILEASSAALPIISTYHAGIPESVMHRETGLLVEEYDDEGLILALKKMLDPKLRHKYGVAGRKFMEEKFSLQNCNRVLSMYYADSLR